MNDVTNINPRCIDPVPAEPISFIEAMRRDWIAAGLMSADPPTVHQPTIPATQKEEDAKVRAFIRSQRMMAFKASCPAEFRRAINRDLIPNLPAWDEADAWTGTHPGVWLWSAATGRAKSRMLWRQFGRLHVEHGKAVLKISGQALAEEYFSFHMDGEPRSFYHWVMAYDIVMIDDIDKIDIADKRAPRMLRELFDQLYEHQKPVLCTANEPIEHFQKRIGDSTARRMSAVCREIQF